tara:strand:- start:796 stop:1248 length:453 start_codon:yes stop_codon:yes gene_type:complete
MIDEDYSMEIQGVSENLVSVEKERQAYKMLQSVPYSLPPAEFNWELAARGFYSKMQKERSDKAFDEFEKELQPKISSEMKAFLELEQLGIYNEKDQFNPNKADNDFYTQRLERIRKLRGNDTQGGSGKIKSNRSIRNQSNRFRKRYYETN